MLTPLTQPAVEPGRRLRREWMLAAAVGGLALGATALWLGRVWSPLLAARWLLPASAVALFELWLVRRYLGDHTKPDRGEPLAALGAGNAVTLLRGLAVAMMSGFLATPLPDGPLAWLPAALCAGGALLDVFDGYAARLAGTASRLGEILDVEFDALTVLLVSALAVRYGNLPWWFVPLGAARYAFMWGLARRTGLGKPVRPLTPSAQRRVTAGAYMAFLSTMLVPVVNPPGTYVAAVVFATPYAVLFLRDWLVVSAAINPASAAYRGIWVPAAAFARRWLPPALRLAIAALVAWAGLQRHTPDWGGFAMMAGLSLSPLGASVFSTLTLLAAGLVTAGVLTRLAATLLIVAAAADVLTAGLSLPNGALLAATCALPALGGGAFTLWEPESDGIFRRRLGEPDVD